MKMVLSFVALFLAFQPADAQRPAGARAPALRPGMCRRTTISHVGQRLEDGVTHRVIPDSGSAVDFANGLGQVSYDQVPAPTQARRGDPVFVCLMRLPDHCPPGDVRGKLYTTTNLRTDESWTLPDSAHGCGGA